MRPNYETESDRNAQAGVISHAERAWQCKAVAMPKFSEVDYALERDGKVRAWAEVKVRNNSSTRYRTYLISLHKWMNGIRQAEFTGLKFLLVVGFTDGVFSLECNRSTPVSYEIGGRKDRGDSQDMEAVVMIPMEHFKKLG